MYLFIFLFVLYLFISQANYIGRFVYPFLYREVIVEEAKKNNLDPLLIAAVVWVESSFNDNAESAKGARGLMQVMPETGLWAAEQIGMENFSKDKLFDPYINITIGTWYLGDLYRQFDGNPCVALAAYNGGRGHVRRWLLEGIWDGSRENLKDIPFPETRSFVIKVEQTYKRYNKIYNIK